jgi:hypothetical protein
VRVAVPGRVSTMSDGPTGLEIVIPAKRSVLVLLFLAAWLGGWFFGEKSAIEEILRRREGGPDYFMVFWLIGWTIGGAWAAGAWLWMALGREVVTLRPQALLLRREVLGIGRTREYDLSHVRNLRVAPEPADVSAGRTHFGGLDSGLVAFDYGARTFRFGGAVDEAEAVGIVGDLKARHPFSEGPA